MDDKNGEKKKKQRKACFQLQMTGTLNGVMYRPTLQLPLALFFYLSFLPLLHSPSTDDRQFTYAAVIFWWGCSSFPFSSLIFRIATSSTILSRSRSQSLQLRRHRSRTYSNNKKRKEDRKRPKRSEMSVLTCCVYLLNNNPRPVMTLMTISFNHNVFVCNFIAPVPVSPFFFQHRTSVN